MKSRVLPRLAISVVAMLLFTKSAFAGPPLICHPLQVGDAKLLPLIDWNQKGTSGYNLKNLSRDTLTILDSKVPVLLRMETLRRATIYARHDSQVAKELLTRMHERANSSSGQSEALAWFDLGYLTEAYKQWLGKDGSNPAAGLDGYAWVKKAISLRGQDDPEMEFAAALITFAGPEAEHRDHVQKAMAGAKSDPLLAQNLASRFGDQTTAEVLNITHAGRLEK